MTLPLESLASDGDGTAHHALVLAGGHAVFIGIHPEGAIRISAGKREVFPVGVKRIPFDEEGGVGLTLEGIMAGDLALGCAVDEGLDDLFVGHGVCWCWLRDQSRLVFNGGLNPFRGWFNIRRT